MYFGAICLQDCPKIHCEMPHGGVVVKMESAPAQMDEKHLFLLRVEDGLQRREPNKW